MRVLLFLVSVVAALAGAAIFLGAKSAIHEIEAFILFLIAAVLFSAAALIDAVIDARKKVETVLKSREARRTMPPEGNLTTEPDC